MKSHSHRLERLARHTAFALIVAAAAVSVGARAPSPAKGFAPAKGPAKSLKLDHFWCYIVSSQTPQAALTAILTDQFQTATVSVGEPLQFCNAAQKTVGGSSRRLWI